MVNRFRNGYLEFENRKQHILKITIITSAIFLSILSVTWSKDDPDHTRFVSVGHTYKFLDYPKVMPQLVERINGENPDYVIVHGDVVWLNLEREWKAVNKWVKSIQAEVFHTPGNHDIYFLSKRDTMNEQIENLQTEILPKYRERWGYDKKIFTDRNATLTLINSLDEAGPINEFLRSIQSSLSDENPNFLFTHHEIWNDVVRTNAKTWHEKPFYFHEISDNLVNFDFIITNHGFQVVNERMIPQAHPVITAAVGSGYVDAMYLVVDIYPDRIEVEKKKFKIVGESDEEKNLIPDNNAVGRLGRNTRTAIKNGDRWVLQSR